MTETLSNFLAGIYGDLNIAIYSDDSHQEPDKLYNGSITQLPEDILTRYGESAIDVFDENMNPIHGGFVNTNIVIILRNTI